MNQAAQANDIKVTFINPTSPQDVFWGMVTTAMQAAADDLDIELNVVYARRNWLKSLDIAKRISNLHDKPDYLVYIFQSQVTQHILNVTERAGVKSFIINTNVPENEVLKIGKPRKKYQHWIGHMFPDDEHAGYLLAKMLVDKVKNQNPNSKINMIALGGERNSSAFLDRSNGASKLVERRNDVSLSQLVYAYWEKEKAYQIVSTLLKRYPDTNAIWAASDEMSLGAVRAIEESGKKPGKDIFTGGFDWTQNALKAIESGEIVGTVGGHFMEGAWAMVLLHDHFHGIDFVNNIGTTIKSKLSLLKSDNVLHYQELHSIAWLNQINFRSFSRKFHTDLSTYDFRLPILKN